MLKHTRFSATFLYKRCLREGGRMDYFIMNIEKPQDISKCEVCSICNYNWGGDYRPAAYTQMGMLTSNRLLVHMWAEEVSPTAVYTCHQDPVYLDSALEFFIRLPDSDIYYNFEINSNGALLAQSGTSKDNRIPLPKQLFDAVDCRAEKNPEDWHVYLTLPLDALTPQVPDHFFFNLYKIKESPGNTHFASFSPIISEKPNFHLVQFFSRAKNVL